MPLFDHLGELRMRLVRIVACLAIAVVVFYMATPTMGQFLLQPIFDFLPKNADGSLALIALDPFESFATRFKISIWASIVACSPVILWQILAFFLPALKPKERKWFVPTFGAAVALFVFGTVFCTVSYTHLQKKQGVRRRVVRAASASRVRATGRARALRARRRCSSAHGPGESLEHGR